MILLRDVYTEPVKLHREILFTLLRERKPYQNISHKEMPTFKGHIHFVESRPYKQWYIIYGDAKPVGAVYLSKDNEIGIWIFELWQGMGYAKEALNTLFKANPSVREFKANISPKNSHSIAFFANEGFVYKSQTLDQKKENIIQYTYVKSNPYFPE